MKETIIQHQTLMNGGSGNKREIQIACSSRPPPPPVITNGQQQNGVVEPATSSSPASSSRSYRRIKELKNNSINSKKNQAANNLTLLSSKPSPYLEATYNNEEDYLKKSLVMSFTKRRERKGSLPEINPSVVLNDESTSSFNMMMNGTVVNLNESVAAHQNNQELYYHPLTSTQETFAMDPHDDSTAANRRESRKSAFVLEVFRTSMFRSKSLTDLNSSIVKSENYATMANNSSNVGTVLRSSNKNLACVSNKLPVSMHEK
jgi:hypothetical protein